MIRMSFFLDIQALNICFSGHYRRNLFLTFFSFVFAFTANAQSEMPGCTDSNACNYDLTATFDNLGKGASRAAIQSMELMLGL